MNIATSKLDCRCPHCLTNYDVAMRHDGKTVTCNRCKQLFSIAFSFPESRRPLSQTRYNANASPGTTPFPHIQANTHFVVIASMLALIVAVATLGLAIARGTGTAEAPKRTDLAEMKTQELANDGSARFKNAQPTDS